MKNYRKKPVVIQAIQLTSENIEDVEAILGYQPKMRRAYKNEVDFLKKKNELGLHIKTLEGDMLASIGDYIIKGVKGEFYPCKPDIFEMTYESAD